MIGSYCYTNGIWVSSLNWYFSTMCVCLLHNNIKHTTIFCFFWFINCQFITTLSYLCLQLQPKKATSKIFIHKRLSFLKKKTYPVFWTSTNPKSKVLFISPFLLLIYYIQRTSDPEVLTFHTIKKCACCIFRPSTFLFVGSGMIRFF